MRMQSRQQTTEESSERAVSPVIGVILMVAITVILAAVIAAFVLDIGPGETDPNAGYSTSDVEDGVEVELNSLDSNTDGIIVVWDVTNTDSSGEIPHDDELTVAGASHEFTDSNDFGDDSALIAYNNGGDSLDDGTELDDLDSYAIIDNLDDYHDD